MQKAENRSHVDESHKGRGWDVVNEIKLVRFVDIHACKRIFSDHSTFVLGSPAHYRYPKTVLSAQW